MDKYSSTVGELRRQLESFSEDDEISFEGGLTLGRIKRRGANLVNIEFAEVQALLDKEFKVKHPEVLVAFLKPEK